MFTEPVRHHPSRDSFVRRALAFSVFLIAAVFAAIAPSGAVAATSCTNVNGQPTISVTKSQPAIVLYGAPVTVTLNAAEPIGQTYGGFNLSYRDVLPAGASYVPGSSTIAPQQIAGPGVGETTLIFSNVADLAPGSDNTLTYEVTYATAGPGAHFLAGQTLTTGTAAGTPAVGAYVNCDAREIPQFSSTTGLPVGDNTNSYSRFATAAPQSTELRAIEIEKSEPSPEHELLRGVHKNQTVYSLKITNNAISATDNVFVEDYLPAGLEFLGCATLDNTTNAPTNPGNADEYPGSGPINAPGNAPTFSSPCLTPALVETVTIDPDGPGSLPIGVYTHVRWNLGADADFSPSGNFTMQYAAAVPVCPNTLSWNGPTPATDGPQTSNLNNNNCLGGETLDESALTNLAVATGDYTGVGGGTVSDSDDLTVTAEDLAIQKSVSSPNLVVGTLTTWTFDIETSEYRTFTATEIDDLLPNGYCPIDGTNNNYTSQDQPSDAQCDGTGNAADNPVIDGVPTTFASANTSLAENNDGTWNVGFALGDLASDDRLQVSFKSRTRHDYQSLQGGQILDSAPILAGDTLTNDVSITGANHAVCSSAALGVVPCPGAPQIPHTQADGAIVEDESSASQTAGEPTLKKTVRQPGLASPVDCSTGTYDDGPAVGYRPGDIVCWKLQVTFPVVASTGGVSVTDFLPIGYAFANATGDGGTIDNDFPSATATADGRSVQFDLGVATVDNDGLDFDWILASRVTNTTTIPNQVLPTIRANLLKVSTTNTEGYVTTLRDEADAEIATPALTITKGVKSINGVPGGAGFPANTEGSPTVPNVSGGDAARFRIDLTNPSTVDVVNGRITERLVGPYDCTMISAISDSGSCASTGSGATAVTTVTWTGVPVSAGGTKELNWTFTVPELIAPIARINDVACVSSYDNSTNDAANPTFTHVPDNPVATCGNPPSTPTIPNPVGTTDTSYINAAGSIAKTAATSVTETNNNAANQATIGEEITYTSSLVIPAHTTVRSGTVVDTIQTPTRQVYVASSVECQLDGSVPNCATAGATASFASNVVTLTLPTTYVNSTNAAQTFALIFRVKVADIAGNTANATLANRATFNETDQYGAAQATNSNSTSVRVVEPNLLVAKSDDAGPTKLVAPNQEVQYTLTVTNPARTSPAINSSPAHDITIEDQVPTGVTPTDGNGTPIADGGTIRTCAGATPSNAGVWNSATRRITWTITSLSQTPSPATALSLPYCVQVDNNPAGGQSLTNSVTATSSSLDTAVTGERSYTTPASDTLTVTGASLTKTRTAPASGNVPIGDTATFDIVSTLPANTQFFDYKIVDAIPAGMQFVSYTVSCDFSCPVPSVSNGGGDGDDLTLSFGDLPADTVVRHITASVTTRVLDVANNQSGFTLTDSGRASWNTASTGGTTVTTPDADASATVVEPHLTIDKDVNGQSGDSDVRNVQPGGGTLAYRIAVTNDGTSDAFNVAVTDMPDGALTGVVNGPAVPGVTVTKAWSAGDHSMGWTIDQIPAGGTVTFTYTAQLVASANLTNGQTIPNTAAVASYQALSSQPNSCVPTPAPQCVNYRVYPEAGDNPSDTVTLTVRLPQLSIAKTTSTGSESGNAQINQPFGWRIVLSNTSTYAVAYSVDFSDTLPSGWVYDANSASFNPGGSAEPSIAGQVLTWSNIGSIAPGASITLDFTAHPTMGALSSGNPVNPYVNSASGTGDDGSGASGSASGPYAAGPDTASADIQMPVLGIAKTPDAGTATAGANSSFDVAVSNTGAAPARSLVVRDELPAGLSYTAGTATATGNGVGFTESSVTVNGDGSTTIVWTFTSLPASGSATIHLPVHVSIGTPDGTTYTNTAYTHSTERPTDISDAGSIVVGEETDLGVTKTVTNFDGQAGDEITYSIVATNFGPSNATNVHVTDVVDTAKFDFVEVSGDLPDSCTYDTPSHTIDCAVSGTLSPLINPTRTFTVVLKVKSGLTGSVANTAVVAGDQPEPDPDPHPNTDTATTPLGTNANLSITKDVSTGEQSTILNHDETEFTIVVKNNGPSDALQVHVEDDLPDGLSCVSASNAGVGCPGAAGDTVTWDLGTIVAGDSVTLTVTVRGEEVGDDWLNTATVSSPTDPTDSSDTATVTVDPMADLEIVKSTPGGPNVESGADFEYSLSITNNGPDSAVTPQVTDTVPAGLELRGYNSLSGPIGTCAIVGQQFTCDLPTLAPGDTSVITLLVNAGFDYNDESVTNTAHVESPVTPDTIPSNNTDDATVDVGPNADLAIVKSGPAYGAEGYALTYTLSVVNNGPATAEDAEVEDVLPAGLTFQSVTSTVGTCSQANGTVTCGLGDMTIGATAQITIVVVPQASLIGTTIHNTATIGSTTPDPIPSNNESSVDTPIENNQYPTSSNVTLTKTSSNNSPKIGDTITYTLTASNSGPDTARGVVITDTLPSALIYVSSSSGCTYSAPAVICQVGDISAGASASITITVIVGKKGTIVNTGTVTASNDRNPNDNSAVDPISAGASTAKLSLTKQASKKTVKVGAKVQYTIKVKNISKTTAVNVEVCDLVPSRLSVVKTAGGKLKSGNLCWTIQTLAPGRSKTYKPTFRVANGASGTVTNPARAKATNAKTVRANARVHVPRLAPHGGGTTG